MCIRFCRTLVILGAAGVGVKALNLNQRLADDQSAPLQVRPAGDAGPKGDGHTPRPPRKAA